MTRIDQRETNKETCAMKEESGGKRGGGGRGRDATVHLDQRSLEWIFRRTGKTEMNHVRGRETRGSCPCHRCWQVLLE